MTTNQGQTLMDYLTLTLGDTTTILLPKLAEGVTFDFKHEFIQMLKNNLFNGVTHEDPTKHLRKFTKLTNMVRQNWYFSPMKTNQYIRDIGNFMQREQESLLEA
ncbi:hypothetical protein HKD37_01G000408 [Glycine soja]